jgi:hypothetical protein
VPRSDSTAVTLNDLADEILTLIFSFLSDLDLMSIAQVSRRFHALQPCVLLSNMEFPDDDKPIVPRGTKKTPISSQQHMSLAVGTLLHAFRVRVLASTSPRIFLYRVRTSKRRVRRTVCSVSSANTRSSRLWLGL